MHAARRGQAAVFVALSLMALMLVVAFATNMGIAVNDRIRMQETADLATYAVAYSEADSLNDLTLLNKDIADAAADCRTTLEHGGAPWATPCNCSNTDPQAEIELQLCKVEIDAAILAFVERAQYDVTVGTALQAGLATAEANFDGTEKHTSFMDKLPGSPTMRWTYTILWQTSTSFGYSPSIANFSQVTETAFNYQYLTFCDMCEPAGPFIRTPVTIPTWFYKETRDPDVWVAGRTGGTPKKRFLDTSWGRDKKKKDGGYFGASSTTGDDKLVAYAVAKPYDGSVGPSEQSGIWEDGNLTAGGVYVAQGIDFPKETMVDEYRARMAGIRDDLEGSVKPEDLIWLDGATLGKNWDTSRFEH